MTFVRTLAAIGAITFAAIALPALGVADGSITSTEDGKRKINLSGRQRMLTQRMAKAVCFAALQVDVAGHRAMARDAHALFDVTLHGLRHGSPELGMLKERAPAVLVELDSVDTLWAQYGAAVEAAAAGDVIDAAMLARVAALSVPTLVQMNTAVGEFEKRYGSTEIHPSLALALNVSGRQRMLTQRASKEFCLVAHGHDATANRDALAGTVELFETSLAALRHGDYAIGLPEAPTHELEEQLDLVYALWAPLSTVFRATAAGALPDAASIARVAADNDAVLREMNRAVGMYEAL